MIYFDVMEGPSQETFLNGHKLTQMVSCEYGGATYIFTSVAKARDWADNKVHQNHTGLPPVWKGNEGGWKAGQQEDGCEHH